MSEEQEPASTRGGRREGAGRPPSENPRKPRSLRLTDDVWQKLERLALAADQSPAEWVADRVERAKDPIA